MNVSLSIYWELKCHHLITKGMGNHQNSCLPGAALIGGGSPPSWGLAASGSVVVVVLMVVVVVVGGGVGRNLELKLSLPGALPLKTKIGKILINEI